MSILQWISELGQPKKACARKGHKMRDWSREVFLYPPEGIFRHRFVADVATESGSRCSRCGYETDPQITNRRGLNGLTLSGDGWDRLQSEGRLAR